VSIPKAGNLSLSRNVTHQQEVAARIAQLRREKSAGEKRDVLQKEIAKAAGVSIVTYGRYESGQRKVPEEVVIALAKYYGTTPWFIRYGRTGDEAGAGNPASGTLSQAELDQFRKERDAARRDAASSTTPAPQKKARKVAGARGGSKRPRGAK
jgi:transcriptional regulator with XRE-family HTH domain